MKQRSEGYGDGRVIRVGFHDVPHVGPPFLHDRVVWQGLHSVIVCAGQYANKLASFVVQMDRVITDASIAQITPGAELHSHHNRGSKRMMSFVVQDEGLNFYLRTTGFSWI